MSDIAIYWFRDDLRLNDLAGLSAAAERGPVVALYIWDDKVSEEWLQGDFLKTVSTRGKAIIMARGASSAASAASAAVDHMRSWWCGTPDGDWTSMAITSDGSYGVPAGLIFSFPCTVTDGLATIVQGLEHSEYAQAKIKATADELVSERAAVAELLA